MRDAPAIAIAERLTEQRARIADYCAQLGADELDVALLVVEGLAHGRFVYGELSVATDRRNFSDEASAELRDAMVYAAAALVKLRRSR